METIVVRAFAKINLAIDVVGKRDDGYHLVDMVTIPLKLHDSVEIQAQQNGGDTFLYCDDPSLVCDESNLAYKALNLVQNNFYVKGAYTIFIYKKIPVEAGLGGGSADAAAVIRALARYIPEEQKEKEKKIMSLSTKIGADVPFCLVNKPCRVNGIGEKLTPIKVAYPYHVLIVKPNLGLSTKSVYEAYDRIQDEISHPNIDQLLVGLEKGDEELIKHNMANVLSAPAIKALPLIADLLEEMQMMNFPLSGMSGTGSACFALSKDKHLLERAAHVFEKEGNLTYLTEFNLL